MPPTLLGNFNTLLGSHTISVLACLQSIFHSGQGELSKTNLVFSFPWWKPFSEFWLLFEWNSESAWPRSCPPCLPNPSIPLSVWTPAHRPHTSSAASSSIRPQSLWQACHLPPQYVNYLLPICWTSVQILLHSQTLLGFPPQTGAGSF